jgi:hypothetical protein
MPKSIAGLQAAWKANRLDSFLNENQTNWPHPLVLRFEKHLYLMRYVRTKMTGEVTEEESAAAADELRVELGYKSVAKFLKHLKVNDATVVRRFTNPGPRQGRAGGGRQERRGVGDAFAAAFRHVPIAAAAQVPVPPPPQPVPRPFFVIRGDGPTPAWDRRSRPTVNYEWARPHLQHAGFPADTAITSGQRLADVDDDDDYRNYVV